MLNRPRNLFDEHRRSEASWQTDQCPTARLCWLFAGMAVPVLLVVVRLGQLQFGMPDRFVEPFSRTTETFEPISTHDGRILTADGWVLAEDHRRFSIHVHYRWLEDPPDEVWLREQALSRLDRKSRRDAVQVAEKKREVLAERTAAWQRLSELLQHAPAELSQRRIAIQRRVERIVAHVEARRRHEAESEISGNGENSKLPNVPWWQRLVSEFTTAPARDDRGPVIVREELDYHPLLEDITLEAAAEIEAHPSLYPGVVVRTVTQRVYPQGSSAAHVLGVRTTIRGDELQARKERFPAGDPLDYRTGDRLGRGGVESTYDQHLHGLRGERRFVRNRQGEIIALDTVRQPRPGRDVVLTIHLALQERIERQLAEVVESREPETSPVPPLSSSGASTLDSRPEAGAAAIVLDVRTGEVLASVSAPGFDVRDLVHPDPETWQHLRSDPRRPFFNRVTQMAIPPGSVFKALTAVALLESGQIDPDAAFYCQGYLDRPDRNRCYIFRHFGVGHQHINLADALAKSCNVYFFDAARTIGPEPISLWAQRFGFGQSTGVDLPGERRGQVPQPPSSIRLASRVDDEHRTPWYPGDTLGLAIGQSRLTVTPLQVARLMAAIANGGRLVTPHVVRRIGTTSQGGREVLPVARPIPGLTAGTLDRVREGLERVVAHPGGSGYKTVRLETVRIAGKTGTAEVGGGQNDHAWFAGYVPADRPKYAFAVVLEHAGSGGQEAGPVARQIVESLLELGLITPGEEPGARSPD